MKITERLLEIVSQSRQFAKSKSQNFPEHEEGIFVGKLCQSLIEECLDIIDKTDYNYDDDPKIVLTNAIKKTFRM